ncbi:hypothetical protein [Veronia pacifica]|uniref:hypothetical protein n=1 Tax=Veronia pacifica TaxID=1080227 RepID=UPI001FE13D97|nr:hypothetical protein [Veronia pacifica]
MFTGIVQTIAVIEKVSDIQQVRTFVIAFPEGFCEQLELARAYQLMACALQ